MKISGDDCLAPLQTAHCEETRNGHTLHIPGTSQVRRLVSLEEY